MSSIELQDVVKQFGAQVVLDGVSVVIHPGETVGLVGANGAGKTTLFRIMAGLIAPDLGRVSRASRSSIGLLAQEPDLDQNRTLHDEVASVFDDLLDLEHRIQACSDRIAAASERGDDIEAELDQLSRLQHEFDAADGHRYKVRLGEILSGLGFREIDHDTQVGKLSGGQRCRAALAKLLLQDREILLLDEPTNHLDIDAVSWLEKFLTRHQGAIVIVSHDRYLLDRLCTRVVEVDRCRVSSYPGNYSNFAQTKELRLLTEQRQHEKDAAFIRKERDFIARHLAGQRTAEAKGRRKRLERRLAGGEFVTDVTRKAGKVRLSFQDRSMDAGAVLRCDDLAMAYGDNRLFHGLGFQIAPGERFAITGPNGTGKTTLLRILLGEVEPTDGTVELPRNLKIGHYAQQSSHLDPDRTVLEEIRTARPEMSELEARSYAALYRFVGDEVFKKLGTLSGGEQSRVRLATLILEEPDLLFLDEPTNHLDIPSREVLEEALEDFGGTIIVVSHDRYFLDRTADRLLVLRHDGYEVHAGNYSSYVEACEARAAAAVEKKNAKAQRKPPEPRRSSAAASPFDRMSVDELEALVIEKESALAALHDEFGNPEVYRDPDRLAELRDRRATLEQELEEVDRAWQERAEAD